MKLLILGANGMLGHKLTQILSEQHHLYATLRCCKKNVLNILKHAQKVHLIENISIDNIDGVIQAINISKPQCIINCIGIIKQQNTSKDAVASITINSLFPHRLAQICQVASIRLIHISTDCVFSGRQGNYREIDVPDADDIYGRTKLLGEVSTGGCLTIRTSIIGRELETSHGLIEWFLSQEGKTIKGYKNTIFSGFTTLALAEIISKIIIDFPELSGLYHVSSTPISKYNLLNLVKQAYNLNIEIEPDESTNCDRSLQSERFREATGLLPPFWSAMIEQMCRDMTPYILLRNN